MSEHAPLQTMQTPAPQPQAVNGFHLQRKCSCGSYASGGVCEQCRTNGTELQRIAVNSAKLSSQADLLMPAVEISSPDSPAEREADQVANRMSAGWTKPAIHQTTTPLSVHRSPTGRSGVGIPTSGGMPLAAPAREYFEAGFGRSFHDVRIHTDDSAARLALSFEADAFTLGKDIYFGVGKFDTESGKGRNLIAHELTHTVQQQSGGRPVVHRQPQTQPQGGSTQTPGAAAKPPANPPPILNIEHGSQPQATFDASLAREKCLLTLTKKLRFEFLDEPPVSTWGAGYGPWPEGKAGEFQQNFIAAVTDRWSYKYALKPTGRCAGETCPEFKAAVQVVPVSSGEHTTVQVGYLTGELEPPEMGVTPMGDRARLHSGELKPRKVDDYTQVQAEHEFGHMLGRPHVNAAHCGSNANNRKCYGETPEQMANIMGKGSNVSEADYEPFAYALGRFNGCTWKAATSEEGLSGLEIFGIVAGSLVGAGLIGVGIAAAAGAFKKD